MKLTQAMKNTAATTPITTAKDGKRFVLYEDAFFDRNPYSGEERYIARAFCPDDAPDEDGDLVCYDIHFEITNPDAEEDEFACDWDVIASYEENGDIIEAEDAKVLVSLVRYW